ncbi:hypothetical protein NW759_004083 [Fusarium solani]|nr:hypothetical protein NW759_004083 [Fusarium solani]
MDGTSRWAQRPPRHPHDERRIQHLHVGIGRHPSPRRFGSPVKMPARGGMTTTEPILRGTGMIHEASSTLFLEETRDEGEKRGIKSHRQERELFFFDAFFILSY